MGKGWKRYSMSTAKAALMAYDAAKVALLYHVVDSDMREVFARAIAAHVILLGTPLDPGARMHHEHTFWAASEVTRLLLDRV